MEPSLVKPRKWIPVEPFLWTNTGNQRTCLFSSFCQDLCPFFLNGNGPALHYLINKDQFLFFRKNLVTLRSKWHKGMDPAVLRNKRNGAWPIQAFSLPFTIYKGPFFWFLNKGEAIPFHLVIRKDPCPVVLSRAGSIPLTSWDRRVRSRYLLSSLIVQDPPPLVFQTEGSTPCTPD